MKKPEIRVVLQNLNNYSVTNWDRHYTVAVRRVMGSQHDYEWHIFRPGYDAPSAIFPGNKRVSAIAEAKRMTSPAQEAGTR